MKAGAECPDSGDGDGRIVGNRKSSAPDTHLDGMMDEALNALRQSARLAKARGEEKKRKDYRYEEEEVRGENVGGEAADGYRSCRYPKRG
jgi:hypothetical protein